MYSNKINISDFNFENEPCLSKSPEPNSALDKFNIEFDKELQNYIDKLYQLEDIVRKLTGDEVPPSDNTSNNDSNSTLGIMHNHLNRLSVANVHLSAIVKTLKSIV